MSTQGTQSRERRQIDLMDRFVTAAENIAKAMVRQTAIAEEGLEIARENLKVHQQMAGTSSVLENELAKSMTGRKPE